MRAGRRAAAGGRTAAVILAALIAATAVGAAAAPGVPSFPPPEGYVSDFAHVLDAGSRASLEARLSAYDQATTNQIAIALFPDLGGVPIDDFTVRLEEAWKVGRKGRDNGVLLAAAMAERQIRIEVGYGLEAKITDADAGRIIRDDIAPAFRAGRYADGLNAAVDAIIALAGSPATTGTGAPGLGSGGGGARTPSGGGGLAGLLFLAFIALAWLVNGRSGSRRCPRCGARMHLVSQSTDSDVGAVEAWSCPRCGYRDKRIARRRQAVLPVPYVFGGGWGSGGFGGGSGGGFGGFGGGGSGGGGASGGW